MRPTLLIISVFLCLRAGDVSSAVEPGHPGESDFAWFAGLGLIDLQAPFAVIQSPVTITEKTEYQSRPAFLIHLVSDQEWTAQTLDLNLWRQNPKDTPAFAKYLSRVEKTSLREYAALRLGGQYKRGDEAPFIKPVSEHLEIFILAAACWQQGAKAEAAALYERAMQMVEPQKNASSFRERMAEEIALRCYWLAILKAGEPSVPRAELRREFAQIADLFPVTKHGRLAEGWLGTLDRMVEEEKRHPVLSEQELAQLPVERQVAEWIYRLRDQNGRQYIQPGSCDVFSELGSSAEGTTPAHQLASLGFAAVPKLIESLDDNTPTRSLGFGRDFRFSHTILTVGDCSEAILSRIAGEPFYSSLGRESAYMTTSGATDETKRLVEAWWKDCGPDELGWMKRAIMRGDRNSVLKAQRLHERFPDVAEEVIRQAITTTADGEVRAGLVRTLGSIRTPEVSAFLLSETEGPGPLSARVEAGRLLRERGDLRGEKALLAHWKELIASDKFMTTEGAWKLASFLGGSASGDTLRLLADALPLLPPKDRLTLLECIVLSPIYRLINQSASEADPTRVEILIEALADKARIYGPNENLLFDPRVCDYAARWLGGLGERSSFQWNAALDERYTMILRMQNDWRARHGLKPISEPVDKRPILPPNAANQITDITFGVDAGALPEDFQKSISELRGRTVTLECLQDLLAEFSRLDPSDTPRIGFEFIRSPSSRGVSLRVESIPGSRTPDHECWSLAVLTWPPSEEPHYEVAWPRPGYGREEFQWTRLVEPFRTALQGEVPFEIRGRLYNLKGDN